MADFEFHTPVLFTLFNRPDITRESLAAIRLAKPKQLFVAVDGPRDNKSGETEKVKAVQKVIDEGVDWDCEVKKLYREENLGCQKAMAGAITWFFEQVEEGIILEDDCVPHPTFWRYCQELLDKYRDNEKIMHISGDNFQFGRKRGRDSYYFSIFNHCTGWAGWRRAWKKFDLEMKEWPKLKKEGFLKTILKRKADQMFWEDTFQEVYEGKISSWAFIWTLDCWRQGGLTCLPNVNLIRNIGFGEESTHTPNPHDPSANLETEAMEFPMKHPENIGVNQEADDFTLRNKFHMSIGQAYVRRALKKTGVFEVAKKAYFGLQKLNKKRHRFTS